MHAHPLTTNTYCTFLRLASLAALLAASPTGYLCSILYSSYWFTAAALVVDWHNIGFSMFSSRQTFIRSVVRSAEVAFGSTLPSGGLCVTEAMKGYLREEFGVKRNVHVLHDRPTKYMKKGGIRRSTICGGDWSRI